MGCDADAEKPFIQYLPDFWDRLRDAGPKFLALDYDGTLAPFHAERMNAFPVSGISDLLRQIQTRGDTTLAIISGRPIFELVTLLGNISVTMVGNHGFEFRDPHGDTVIKKITPEQAEGLVKAQGIGIEMGGQGHLETKTASIALHTRGLRPDQAFAMEEEISRRWEGLCATHKLETRRFNGGVELRASNWNKGDALEMLLRGLPKDTLCVYIGDDETDEDAFERIRPYGFGIRVGDPCQPSKASGFLPDIDAVKSFLEGWKNSLPCDS